MIITKKSTDYGLGMQSFFAPLWHLPSISVELCIHEKTEELIHCLGDMTQNSNVFGNNNTPLSKKKGCHKSKYRDSNWSPLQASSFPKFGVSFTTVASGFPPPTGQLARETSRINCQTVCLSFDHTASLFSVENGGETVFMCSRTPTAVFHIFPVLLTQIIWADVHSTWRRTYNQIPPVQIMDVRNISCL